MDALTLPLVPWLVTYLLHSTLLLGGALLAARWVRSPGARDVIWKGALFGALATATAQGFLGRGPEVLSVAPAPASVSAAAGARAVIGMRGNGEKARGVGGSLAPADPADPAAARPDAPAAANEPAARAADRPYVLTRGAWLAALWALFAGALAARLAWRAWSMRRLFASRRPLAAPHLRAAARRLAGRGGFVLSESDRIRSPVALGRREVCMPARALLELGRDEQEAMLAHELAHLERRDPAWLFAAHVVEALFCVQPLVRWVRRRMQDDMEYLCDAWAAERTARPVPLARCLATVAGWLEGQRTPALAPGMATTDSRLVQRVEALLGGAQPRGRGAARVATVATGLALVALACVGPHAEEGDAGDERGHVLAMQEDGSVLVDGHERVGLDALGAWLSALDEREAARVLTIEAAEGARYEDVRRLVDLCREARFDALRLEPYGAAIVESDGASGRIHARIVEHEADDGSEELLIVLAISGPGQRVNPDGTPWSGQGKFRYDETRKLRYTVDGLILDSLRDVEQRLAAKRRAAPDRKVLIDAQAGVVYRDVVDVLDGVVRAGFTHISFMGAYDDVDDDESVPLDAEPEERGARDRRALDTEVERLAGALEQGRAGLLTSAGPDGDTRHWLMLLEDGDLRGLAEYDAQDDAGHWRRVHAALRDAAAGMPRAAAQAMPPLELARDRLTIHADPGAPFMHVQRIMELCGSLDVQIWKVELQRGGGAQAPVIPVFLPLDADVVHAENDLSDGPGERVEVVLRELDGGAMQYTIGSWRSRDLPATCERLTMLLARERRATGADARPLIDVCAGVNAGTVLDLLERLQADGQESFSFVGYRKER